MTITVPQLVTASNQIGKTVFQQLVDNNYVFSDNSSDPINFAPASIVKIDAGAGLSTFPPGLDYAAWGGTLFARTALNDPTYFSDNNINLTPGSTDCQAITAGDVAAVNAVAAQAGQVLISSGPAAAISFANQGISNIQNVDMSAIRACFPNGGNLGNGSTYNFDNNGDLTITTTNAGGSTTTSIVGSGNTYANVAYSSSSATDVFISGAAPINYVDGASVIISDSSSATLSGNTNNVYFGAGAGGTIYGNSDDINVAATTAYIPITGSNETINLTPNSGSHIGVDGTDELVAGNSGSDIVGLAGTGTSATVSGTGYVGLTSSDESLALVSSGASAGTVAGTTQEPIEEIIDASSATIHLAAYNADTLNGAPVSNRRTFF